jgi:SAM-dependent methyltransferase
VPEGHYADSFGFQWIRHAKTQLDSVTGLAITRQRFFEATKWPENLKGEVILEVGCGAGRFTEVAAATGAMVISVDASRAVDANYESNGSRSNLLIVQAEIEHMPFLPASFDRVFCLGVLQHTPAPHTSFLAIASFVKNGGNLAMDIYKKSLARRIFYGKYWVRSVTSRMNPETLYPLTKAWVNFWWPLTRWIAWFPKGRRVNRLLFLIADYTGYLPLSSVQLKEWAVLDTFDMLSPRYDRPGTVSEMRRWFHEAGFQSVAVQDNKTNRPVEGRGVKI